MRKKRKFKKNVNSISILFVIGLLISALVITIQVVSLGILPQKFYLFVILFWVIILLLTGALLLPKIPPAVKMVLWFLVILIVGGCIFGSLKIKDTTDFFKNIGAADYEIEKYYVLVLDNSDYKKIEDLKGKKLGVYPTATDAYTVALKLYDEKVSSKKEEYDDLLKLETDLLSKKVDATLMSDAHKTALEEEGKTFASSIRILDTIEVKTEVENIAKATEVTKKPFNVYISGIDTYGGISTKSRSDVNIIMTIHPETHQIILTHIPRDYYVQLHGTTGLKDKLTHAGVYGINMSIQTIEDLLDVEINYYVRVNFNTLIEAVDVIGGITIDSDKAFTAYTDRSCHFKKGKNTVKGKCALAFARERYAYSTGDRHRGQNQQQVITKMIEKLTSSTTLISNYSELLDSLEGSFQTSMETNQIYALIRMQLDDMPKWDIHSVNLDGTSSMSYTYSYPKQKLSVMNSKEETVTYAKKVIDEIMAGKKYEEIEKN